MDNYVPGRLTPDYKNNKVKVESGFGLCKNEANLDYSRNSINTAHKLAQAWTEPKQGMTKFPMNQSNMYGNYMPVNEPQIGGNNVYSSNTNVKSRNASGQLAYGPGEHGTAVKYSNNPD